MILAKSRDFAYAGLQGKGFRLPGDTGRDPRLNRRGETLRLGRIHPMLRAFIIWLVVLGLLLVYVGERTLIMTLTYELKGLQGELARAQTENDQLFLELTRLGSLDRIEKVARAQLNMVSPQQVELLAVAPMPHPANQVLASSSGEGAGREGRQGGSWARAAERLQSFFGTVARARQTSPQTGWVPVSGAK